MPSPELRCLECNRQFADLTADQEVERCAECGKFVVAAPTLLTATVPTAIATPTLAADLVADVVADDIPTVGKSAPADDLPMAQPVRPPLPQPKATLPAWARRDEDAPAPATPRPPETVRPTFPPRPATTSRPRDEAMSNTELPNQIDGKKQKIGLALFVAFVFFVAMLAAIGVLGYTIVRGLQIRKVLTQAEPVQVDPPLSRTSDS